MKTEKNPIKLDETDIKLINLLQEDCMQPIKNLGKKLNLSIAPTHERIKKLERCGVINKYVAIIDFELVDKPLVNFCHVKIQKHNADKFLEFEKAINGMDEVLECYYVSGEADFILKVVSGNMNEYQNFILNKLSTLDVVSNINSQFVMRKMKYKTSIKLKIK